MTSIYYCLYTIYNTSSTTIRSRILSFFFFQCSAPHPDLHSFPTRRSSDLEGLADGLYVDAGAEHFTQPGYDRYWQYVKEFKDRKSTRLNSSHRCISYAVFCLKKKKKNKK